MSAFSGFEGSYAGMAGKIADSTRLECKICWHVYDPAQGCESWQIPPGTPFSKLPRDWRCPGCDALPAGFMALDVLPPEETAPPPGVASLVTPQAAAIANIRDQEARALGERFEEAFRELHLGKMLDVPFLNKAIQVQAIGFRPYRDEIIGGSTLGVLLTPWFMNLVIVPDEKPDPAPQVGTKSFVSFPSGMYEFIWSYRNEVGPYRACSLFSPVQNLPSQLQAVDIGVEVLRALFQAEHRDEGSRKAEIRALREDKVRRQEAGLEDGEEAELTVGTPAGPVSPTRRSFFVPSSRSKDEEPAAVPEQGDRPA